MAVWKVARLGRASSVTGAPFPPDTEVVTALYGEEEETGEDRVRGVRLVRRDFLPDEATPDRLEGSFCTWRTRTPAERTDREPRLDLSMARDFLVRLLTEDRPDRAGVALALALLLVRKRRLALVEERDGAMVVRWPKETETFTVPAPLLTEADAESLQQEILRLFDV